MPRAVQEWIGKTDNAKTPPRVRERVFDRHGGICHICKLPIKVPFETWQADHVIALINGGENRESNLAPAHSHCHLGKTKLDLAEKSKVANKRKKHLGITRPAGKIKGRGFPKSERAAKRASKPSLPPRPLFVGKGDS